MAYAAQVQLITTSGFPERETFDPIIATFKAEAANFDAESIGEVCIPGSIALQIEPRLLERPLSLVKEAGVLVAETGRLSEELLEQINTPVVGVDGYLQITAQYGTKRKDQTNKCRISVRGFAE